MNIDPILNHLGKALIAKAKGDEYEEGRHLEILVQLADTDTILDCQDQAISLINQGKIK